MDSKTTINNIDSIELELSLKVREKKFQRKCLYTVFEFFGVLSLPALLGLILSMYVGHLVPILIFTFVVSWIYIIKKVMLMSREWLEIEELIRKNKQKSDNAKTVL